MSWNVILYYKSMFFFPFYTCNYSDCVGLRVLPKCGWSTHITVPENILYRHRWSTEAAALVTCCSHSASCVDTVLGSYKWVTTQKDQTTTWCLGPSWLKPHRKCKCSHSYFIFPLNHTNQQNSLSVQTHRDISNSNPLVPWSLGPSYVWSLENIIHGLEYRLSVARSFFPCQPF